jgi:hypothetical protein
MENTEVIFSMLTQDNAKIVEVLPNGKEVELTIYNFAQDNFEIAPKTESVKVTPVAQHVADPKIVNAGQPPVANPIPERQLTRKERRELERKARAEAAKQNTEQNTPSPDETIEVTKETIAEDPEIAEGSSIIDDNIIEE